MAQMALGVNRVEEIPGYTGMDWQEPHCTTSYTPVAYINYY
jgi:hypothetical protein